MSDETGVIARHLRPHHAHPPSPVSNRLTRRRQNLAGQLVYGMGAGV